MSGRRADDERGEVFQGGGSGPVGRETDVRAARPVADAVGGAPGGSGPAATGSAVAEHGIGVGAAVLGGVGAGPAASGVVSSASGVATPVTGPAVPVSVPGVADPGASGAPGSAADDLTEVDDADTASASATGTLGTDSASRLNAGRTSPRGVDRGGHVHRVDVPKTPAQARDRDRDALAPDESRTADVVAAEAEAVAESEPDSLAAVDLTDLTGPQLVGRRLQLARRHAGLSVEAVAAATRIRGTMIRQMEAGDFSRCGGDVYARGHVRALAKAAGVDAEALLSGQSILVVAEPPAVRPSPSAPMSAPAPKARQKAKQKEEKAADRARIVRPAKAAADRGASSAGAAAVATDRRRKDKADVITRQPKSPNWTAAMLVVLLGLVVFAGMQLVGDDKAAPTAAAHVPPAPAPKPAAPVPPPAPAPTGVAVKIAAAGADSWLAVFSADGRKLFDNLLPAGSSQSFQDGAKLDVTFGNAAAIKMQLNGKDVPSVGGSGEVVHITVKPTGVVAG